MNEADGWGISAAQAALQDAIATDRPVVAILGQSLNDEDEDGDRICAEALKRSGIEGSSWNDVFSAKTLNAEFYAWLNERFERRAPSDELVSIADAHFSAVFTSAFNPTLKNLFGTDGRRPEPILVGDPPPPVSRSKLKPRIFHLFGMTGAGALRPPTSRLALKARRSRHARPMNSIG